MKWIKKHTPYLVFIALLSFTTLALADKESAESAVTDVLFDEDMENASFTVSNSGRIDIIFGVAVSDEDYSRVVQRLRAHPDIDAVLPGKGSSNFCPVP